MMEISLDFRGLKTFDGESLSPPKLVYAGNAHDSRHSPSGCNPPSAVTAYRDSQLFTDATISSEQAIQTQ